MRKKNALAVCTLAGLFFVSACSMEQSLLPCAFSAPRAIIGAREGLWNSAGIDFDFANTSGKTVDSVSLFFAVFPVNGQNPFMRDSGILKAVVTARILPGEKKTLSIPLDERLSSIPEGTFIVDFFSVTKLVWSDGSSAVDESLSRFTRNY
jgi:hypothetical protein